MSAALPLPHAKLSTPPTFPPPSRTVYYPQEFGVTGDCTNYQAAGAATATTITTNAPAAIAGASIVLRAGGPRLVLSIPDTQLTLDPSNQAPNAATPTTVVGTITLPQTTDLSAYDELRFDVASMTGTNCHMIPANALHLLCANAAGTVVSDCGTQSSFNPGMAKALVTFPLDHSGDLTAVTTLTFRLDSVVDVNLTPGFCRTHSAWAYDQYGLVTPGGVGFTLTMTNPRFTADLYTSISAITGTTATLATPLVSSVPETSLSHADGRGNGFQRDEGPLLSACLASVPYYATVVFTAGLKIPVASTVPVLAQMGLKLQGLGGGGHAASAANFSAPGVQWIGRGGKILLDFQYCGDIQIENLAFTSPGPMPCLASVNIDMDPAKAGASPKFTTTDWLSARVNVSNSFGFDNWKGFAISQVSPINCEFLDFDHCHADSVGGYGAGFYIGPSYNAKSINFVSCGFSSCRYGARADNGSYHFDKWRANANVYDFYVTAITEPVAISNGNSENSIHALWLNAMPPAQVTGNRWSAICAGAGDAAVWLRGPITLTNNKFQLSNTASGMPVCALYSFGPTANIVRGGNVSNWSEAQSGIASVTNTDIRLWPDTWAVRASKGQTYGW